MSLLPEGFSGLMRRGGGVVNERPVLNDDSGQTFAGN
jgi:hypothetical protein